MSAPVRTALLWAPRVLAVATALFISSFALDAFDEIGDAGAAALLGIVMHLLPTLMLVGTIVLAWRRPLIGAAVFLLLAAVYAATTLQRPDWILAIAGPLALVGLMYLVSWSAVARH